MGIRSLAQIAELAISETDLTVQEFIRDIFIEYTLAKFHKLIPRFVWTMVIAIHSVMRWAVFPARHPGEQQGDANRNSSDGTRQFSLAVRLGDTLSQKGILTFQNRKPKPMFITRLLLFWPGYRMSKLPTSKRTTVLRVGKISNPPPISKAK